ncbi:MAG: hypothetical protein EPO25_17105 [Gammaproteobacteria bacterium]|nr:MAG: hypothetical protein EPO25_17105 [Gammaproteobacteria bacterium]
MRWASAIGLASRIDEAAAEASEQIGAALHPERPDLLLAFASARYGSELDRLPRLLEPLLQDGLLWGCHAGGLIGGGEEHEEEGGVALLAGCLGDAVLTALHLEQDAIPSLSASRESWWRLLDFGPECAASFVLLADPLSIDAEACARGIDRAWPGATVIGALAGGTQEPGEARLFADRDVHHTGALLLALTGDLVIDPVVAQGCRAVGEPLFVTACEGNQLQGLDGRRPREVIGTLFASLEERDRVRFGESLCLGLALPGPRQTVGPGDFLIRNVHGLDPDTGTLWVGARLAPNTVVQFHLRDAEAAARELTARLGAALPGQSSPEAALLFSCSGRGRELFGAAGHDSAALRRLADIPITGMFSAGEIGPVQGATFLHAYSSVFGLVRRRSC